MDETNKQNIQPEQTPVEPHVVTTTQPQAQPIPQQPVIQKKSSSSKKILIACLGIFIVFLLCLGACIAGSIALFGAGFNAAKSSVVDLVCNTDDADVERVYNNETTSAFRSRVTLDQFKAEVKELNGEPCDEIKNLSLRNLPYYIENNWNYMVETRDGDTYTEFSGTIGGKKVNLELMQESNTTNAKIQEFSVE
jgi:hypothetical protein